MFTFNKVKTRIGSNVIVGWVKGGALSPTAVGKIPYGVRSAKGELKNNPVDCFLRGKALQERAFPK